ncbi:MAG: hypothetical protein NTV39_00150 [Candidatus Saccharibacteria bacterium]|nr:hypothetical protein [Candidatus Saccharibacteria bacterium]
MGIKGIRVPKMVIFAVLALLVILACMLIWNYLASLEKVTLNPTPGSTITLSSVNKDGSNAKTVKTTGSRIEISVQSGYYLVKYGKGGEYQDQTEKILINKPLTITTPELSYTDKKLNQLLSDDKSIIHQTIFTFIGSDTSYRIVDDKLYLEGEWYSAKLVPKDFFLPPPANSDPTLLMPPNDNNTLDMLRVVLKKSDNNWDVVAKRTVLAFDNYPDIPKGVITGANKFGIFSSIDGCTKIDHGYCVKIN